MARSESTTSPRVRFRRASGNWAAAGAASVLGLAMLVSGSAVASALVAQNVTEDINVPEISTETDVPVGLGTGITDSTVIGDDTESTSPNDGSGVDEAPDSGANTDSGNEPAVPPVTTGEDSSGSGSGGTTGQTGGGGSDSDQEKKDKEKKDKEKKDKEKKDKEQKPKEVTPAQPAAPSTVPTPVPTATNAAATTDHLGAV